jgi:hypothetical protein
MITPFFNRQPSEAPCEAFDSQTSGATGRGAKFCRQLIFEFCTLDNRKSAAISGTSCQELAFQGTSHAVWQHVAGARNPTTKGWEFFARLGRCGKESRTG